MANNLVKADESDYMAALTLDTKSETNSATCDSKSPCQHEKVSSLEMSALSQESYTSTEVVLYSDNLYRTISSLSEKMQSLDVASDEADTLVDKIGDILTSWNKDFIKLKSHEVTLVSDRIASTPGVLSSFLSLADNILLKLGQKTQWIKCFGELFRCLCLWSSSTTLMKQKLVEEGIVSGIMYVLEVCKDSPASEPLMFLTQLALCILSECLQLPSNIPYYFKTDCDKIVQCFTNSTNYDIRISSIFILSYMESKLSLNQCHHHLRLQSKDVQTVLDELLKSLSIDSIFSSPTSLLKDLQSVILAEQGNAESFISNGMLSIISKALVSSNSDAQREAIILLWKLTSIPTYVEKIRDSDLVPAMHNLQSSNPNLDIAITCVLWDITGEGKSDVGACIAFAEVCYLYGMYEKCRDECTQMLKTSTENHFEVLKMKLLKGKCLYHIFNKVFDELPAVVSPKDYSIKQKLNECIEQAVEAVNLLGFAHDHGFIDEEGRKYLDLSMMYLISSENALKRCERCLLCLQNLKLGKKQISEKCQSEDANNESTLKSKKESKGLQHSHVWPKAIFDAFASGMTKTSSKRLFRLVSCTGVSQLKSPKEMTWFILCKECEQVTGRIEEQFIRMFFKKIYDIASPSIPQNAQKLMYGTWLYQFCISIFFRGIAVLPCNESFKRINANTLYELFTMCRNILKCNYTQQSCSAVPSIHLFINPTSPTSEQRRLYSTIHEALVSPAFLAITDRHSPKIYFKPPVEACLFVAHMGILNVVVDVGSVLPSYSHSINQGGGEYHVPPESERSQLIPQEVSKVFHAVAHQVEVQQTVKPDKLRDSHSVWFKGSHEAPKKDCEETFMLHEAQDCDQKVFYQQGVRPSQDPTNAKNMNFLPRGFNIKMLETNSGSVEVPPGHRILLHCEIRDTDSTYDKGTTVFLAIGDGSKEYPTNKPYAIYHQYDPGMFITVGMFVSVDDLSVTGLLPDEPKQYPQTMCENPNFQENMQYTLMTMLYLTGFSSFKSYFPHAEDKRVHMKCLAHRRCWYCTDRCENCMEPASFGLTEETDGVVLKFCCEECRFSFKYDPKVLNMLPATFQIHKNDGNVTVLPPPNHIPFQRVVDTLYDREVELNTTRTIYMFWRWLN